MKVAYLGSLSSRVSRNLLLPKFSSVAQLKIFNLVNGVFRSAQGGPRLGKVKDRRISGEDKKP